MESLLALLANTGDIVWGVDQNHRIVLWNDAARDHLGYSAREVKGLPCYELLQGCNLEGSRFCRERCGLMQQAKRGNRLEARDVLVRHADGHVITLNISTLTVPEEARTSLNMALVHTSRPAQHIGPDTQLKIRLLGTVSVERPDGTAVVGRLWRRVKVRALLAYLALQRGRRVHREALIDILWPELPYEAALRNLNATVYKLRRSLEPALGNGRDSRYIRYESGLYWLDGAGRHWLDVDVVEDRLNAARQMPPGLAALAEYEQVRELIRGPYLADLTSTAVWSAAEAERYHRMLVDALEALADLFRRQGDAARAHDVDLQLLTFEPLHEHTHQQILTYLIAQGDRPRAVAHFRRFRRDLRQELGLAPGEAIERLGKLAQNL